MSNRLGTPVEAVRAAVAVTLVANPAGNAGVLTPPFGIAQWQALLSLAFVWVASAAAGNRTISVLIKDAAGNLIWQTQVATALVASTTLFGFLGGAVPASNNVGPPITYYAPLPFDLPVPPGSVVEVIDTAAVSTADTCSIAAIVSG